MKGIGIDIVSIEHLEEVFDETFREYVYCDDEITNAQNQARPIAQLAGTFAAKEAVVKAVSREWTSPKDIEIDREQRPPTVKFHNQFLDIDPSQVFLSISYNGAYAVSIAVFY